MKRWPFLVIAAASWAWMPIANAISVDHLNKTVSLLEVTENGSCIFFRLAGVDEANPVVPNDNWFAIEKGLDNANQMYAILLSARITGTALSRVGTNGTVACGHARAVTIDL